MVMLSPGPKKRYVHHLVAEAFVGPRPAGQVVRHRDDDPRNNAAANLVYGTVAQNNQDMTEHGRHWCGRRSECKNGHEYTPANTRIRLRRDGSFRQRVCRACEQDRIAAWSERQASTSQGSLNRQVVP